MEEIIFVTTNSGKIASAQRSFHHIRLVPFRHELVEPRSDDIREIARSKAEQAYRVVGKPCFALDSGFYIDALNGFPRTYVNFALDTLGIEGILRAMAGIENRSACFRECAAYCDGSGICSFDGYYPGYVSEEARGSDRKEKWSDLWSIFSFLPCGKVLAEMEAGEREKESVYCVNSIDELAKWLESIHK